MIIAHTQQRRREPAGRRTPTSVRLGRAPIGAYCAVMPPSITSSEPVTQDDSSDARNSTPLAISSAVPSRPIGVKTVAELSDAHRAQCLNYLRATGMHLCLLMNFGRPRLEVCRVVFDL